MSQGVCTSSMSTCRVLPDVDTTLPILEDQSREGRTREESLALTSMVEQSDIAQRGIPLLRT